MSIMASIRRLAGRASPGTATDGPAAPAAGGPGGAGCTDGDTREVAVGGTLQLDPVAAWLMTDDVAARILATRLLVEADLDLPDWQDAPVLAHVLDLDLDLEAAGTADTGPLDVTQASQAVARSSLQRSTS